MPKISLLKIIKNSIDPVEILQIVYYHQIFSNIQKLCFYSEPKILFNSVKFINLPASLLEIILKRDGLNLSEIEDWENLIKWGLAQEKTLKKEGILKFHMFLGINQHSTTFTALSGQHQLVKALLIGSG